MSMFRFSMGAVLSLALLGATGEAMAATPVAKTPVVTLSPQARVLLKAEVDKAKASNAKTFGTVYDIAANAKELDAAARRPGTPLTMHFKSLGKDALLPMLDVLAFEGHVPADLPESAQSALEQGLVEAVGLLRDTRAVPVLSGILDKAKGADMTRVAAEALARMGTPEAFSKLEASLAASQDATRTRAILGGLGSFRGVPAAQLLASRLDARPDAATARALATALGQVGNAYAWKVRDPQGVQAERNQTREIAARALVRALTAFGGDVRLAAEKALLVIDHEKTPAFIAEVRGGVPADTGAALDAFAKRFAKNPTR